MMHRQGLMNQKYVYLNSCPTLHSFKIEKQFKFKHQISKRTHLLLTQAKQSSTNEIKSTPTQKTNSKELYNALNDICEQVKRAPPSEKSSYSTKILFIFKVNSIQFN